MEFEHYEEGLWYDLSTRTPAIELYALRVEPEFRWRGVGSRFMQALCDWADKHGKQIELEVGRGDDDEGVEDLPAWYGKFGFEWQDGYMCREPKLSPCFA